MVDGSRLDRRTPPRGKAFLVFRCAARGVAAECIRAPGGDYSVSRSWERGQGEENSDVEVGRGGMEGAC